MTFNLYVSLPLADRLQDDRLSPAGEPMDQEEVNLSSVRRWSSADVTFSFCGALRCVDFSRFGSRLFCWWRESELNLVSYPENAPGSFFFNLFKWLQQGSDPRILWWGTTGKLVARELVWEFVVTQTAFLLQRLEKHLYWMLNSQQSLNNDNVQYFWYRGTNDVSVSCRLLNCFLEAEVLILCMECKEWIQLTHWHTDQQCFCGGQHELSLCVCSVFTCHGSEAQHKHLTEPGDGRRLDKPLWLEPARTRSILISTSELKEEKVLSPPLTSGGGEGEG